VGPFENIHLRGVPAEQRIICHHPIYKAEGLPLNGVGRFKNHVATVHKIDPHPESSLIDFFHLATSLLWLYTIGSYQDFNPAKVVFVAFGLAGN
jgi:hypothetical protein